MTVLADTVTIEPSGGIFGYRGCEVYTYTRSQGDEGWMIVAEYLDRRVSIVPVDGGPLRQPVIAALEECWRKRRWPFRAVLLRAHDEAVAARKAAEYFERIDEHVYGIDPRAVADQVGSARWRC